jgi:ABC-type branched-subunit amino acid transport system ATPase component
MRCKLSDTERKQYNRGMEFLKLQRESIANKNSHQVKKVGADRKYQEFQSFKPLNILSNMQANNEKSD